MISMYEGRIGGGKTYLAVSKIMAHLAKGGTVYTNVELKPDGIRAYLAKNYQVELQPDAINMLDEAQTWDFHRYLRQGTNELPTMCVIDEAHLWFNARDHAVTAQTKRALLTFLSQSRKLCVDVVFIVQAVENLDAQFRRLAGEVWRMKDLQKLVVPLISVRYPWPHTLVFRMDAGAKQIMERKLIRRSGEIFDCYNTNALLRPVEFAGQVDTKRILSRVKVDRMALLRHFWQRAEICERVPHRVWLFGVVLIVIGIRLTGSW